MKRLAVCLISIALTFSVGVATSMIYKLPLGRLTPGESVSKEQVRPEEVRSRDWTAYSALVSSAANQAAPEIRLTMTYAGDNAREIKLENLGSKSIVDYTMGLSSSSFEGFMSTTMTAPDRATLVLTPGASTTTCVRALPTTQLTAWVDFIEFADGRTWGPNLLKAAEKPAQFHLPEEVMERLTEEAAAAGQPVYKYARMALEAKFQYAKRLRETQQTMEQR